MTHPNPIVAVMAQPVLTDTERLWQKAVATLDPSLKASLDLARTAKRDVLKQTLEKAEEKRQISLRKRWKIKRSTGDDVIVRDVIEKIIAWIKRFRDVGDIAVQYSPTYASLPWAAVRFVLQAAINETEEHNIMAIDLEYVTRLIARFREFEILYLKNYSQIKDQLEDALVVLYAAILEFLAKAVTFFQQSAVKRILKAPFKCIDEENISRITRKESEVLNFAELVHAERLLNVETQITRMSAMTDESRKIVQEAKHAEMLSWLSSVPFSSHHRDHQEARIPGTGDWLSSHSRYKIWSSSSSSSVLLIHGIPGCGKTSLSSAMIDRYSSSIPGGQTPAPTAYFYCSSSESEPERHTAEGVMRSLARQLTMSSSSRHTVHAAVSTTYDQKLAAAKAEGFTILRPRISDCLDILLEVLQTDPAAFIIDAIDELGDPEILLNALNGLSQRSSNVLKILLTCRDDSRIFALLSHATAIRITTGDNSDDVRKFAAQSVDNAIADAKLLLGHVSQDLKQRLIDALASGAGEMFLWVKLQLSRLCLLKTEGDIREALRGLAQATVDELYQATYERILNAGDVAQEVATRTFAWLLYVCDPLTPEVFLSAISSDYKWDRLELTALVNICHNFIYVDTQLDVLRFAHHSVQEFLRLKPLFAPQCAQQILALSCVSVCCEPPMGDLTALEPTLRVYDYAALYWGHHCAAIESPGQLNPLHTDIENFLFDEDGLGIFATRWLEIIKATKDLLPPDHPQRIPMDAVVSADLNPLFPICIFGMTGLLKHRQWPHGFNWDQRNESGQTALYLASYFGHHDIVSHLVHCGADINADGGKYGSAIHCAAFRGHSGLAKLLLQRGANASSGTMFETAVHAACRGDKESTALELLANGFDIGDRNTFESVLRAAAEAGFAQVMAVLHTHHLSDLVSPSGRNLACTKAIISGKLKALQCLLGKNKAADMLPSEALALCAFHGHEQVAEYLLDSGFDVEAAGQLGTPLRCASLNGHVSVVRLLLDKGANVNGEHHLGNALHSAAMKGHTHIARLLLDSGADINAAGGSFGNSIQAAAYHGHEDMVELLLQSGADVHGAAHAKNAIHAAAEGGSYHVLKLFIKHSISLQSPADKDMTQAEDFKTGQYPEVANLHMCRRPSNPTLFPPVRSTVNGAGLRRFSSTDPLLSRLRQMTGICSGLSASESTPMIRPAQTILNSQPEADLPINHEHTWNTAHTAHSRNLPPIPYMWPLDEEEQQRRAEVRLLPHQVHSEEDDHAMAGRTDLSEQREGPAAEPTLTNKRRPPKLAAHWGQGAISDTGFPDDYSDVVHAAASEKSIDWNEIEVNEREIEDFKFEIEWFDMPVSQGRSATSPLRYSGRKRSHEAQESEEEASSTISAGFSRRDALKEALPQPSEGIQKRYAKKVKAELEGKKEGQIEGTKEPDNRRSRTQRDEDDGKDIEVPDQSQECLAEIRSRQSASPPYPRVKAGAASGVSRPTSRDRKDDVSVQFYRTQSQSFQDILPNEYPLHLPAHEVTLSDNPLVAATARGHSDVVDLLLDHQDRFGVDKTVLSRALIIASENGHDEIVEKLLICGIDHAAELIRPVSKAAEYGHTSTTSLLLNNTTAAARTVSFYFRILENSRHSADAILNVLRYILQNTEHGSICLNHCVSIAAGAGSVDILQFILDQNHSLDQNTFENAFKLACDKGDAKTASFLQRWARPRRITPHSLVQHSIRAFTSHHVELFSYLLTLDENCPISSSDSRLLILAAGNGHLRIVRAYLHGDDTVRSLSAYQALGIAAKTGHHDVCELLLDKDLDPNVSVEQVNFRDLENTLYRDLFMSQPPNRIYSADDEFEGCLGPSLTALESCILGFGDFQPYRERLKQGTQDERLKIIRMILQHGGSPATALSDTVVLYAMRHCPPDVISLLMKHDASLRSDSPRDLLHSAIQNSNEPLQAFQLLLEADSVGRFTIVDLHGALGFAGELALDVCRHVVEKMSHTVLEQLGQASEQLSRVFSGGYGAIIKYSLHSRLISDSFFRQYPDIPYFAAAAGSLDFFQVMIDRNLLIREMPCGLHGSPLIAACIYGHFDVAQLLIAEGVELNNVGEDVHTPLEAAIAGNHAKIANLLIQSGADVLHAERQYGMIIGSVDRYRPFTGSVPLLAMACGIPDVHASLIENLINAHSTIPFIQMPEAASLDHPIHVAVRAGRSDLVQLLLEKRCPMDGDVTSPSHPLGLAISSGNEIIVGLLLGYLQDISSTELEDLLAFALIITDQAGIFKLILCHGSGMNILQTTTSLLENVLYSRCSKEVLELFFDHLFQAGNLESTCIDTLQDANFVALRCLPTILEYIRCPANLFVRACALGLDHIVHIALDQGLDPLCEDDRGRSALHFAAVNGRFSTVKLLLSKLEGTDSQHSTYDSALTVALEGLMGYDPNEPRLKDFERDYLRSLEDQRDSLRVGESFHPIGRVDFAMVVQTLLEYGERTDQNGSKFASALHLASFEGLSSVFDDLIAHGADLYARDRQFDTVLQAAVTGDSQYILSRVLQLDSPVAFTQEQLGDVLCIACKKFNLAAIEALLNHGGSPGYRDASGKTPLGLYLTRWLPTRSDLDVGRHVEVFNHLVRNSDKFGLLDETFEEFFRHPVTRGLWNHVLTLVTWSTTQLIPDSAITLLVEQCSTNRHARDLAMKAIQYGVVSGRSRTMIMSSRTDWPERVPGTESQDL